jgi:hypothetical protein
MREENGGKQMKTVWRIPPPGRAEKTFGKHPTQKPVALIDRCLRASTNPGDLVFDPFAGSGASGVAAIKLGRRFIGCETQDEYVELIRKRLPESVMCETLISYDRPSESAQHKLFEVSQALLTRHNGKGRNMQQVQKSFDEHNDMVLIIPDYGDDDSRYPGNIQPGHYDQQEIVDLMRLHKHDPEAIQFLADMMEV